MNPQIRSFIADVAERTGITTSELVDMFRRHGKTRTRKIAFRAKAKTSEAVKVYPDGREVCQNNTAGRAEYYRRTYAMNERQGFRCAICGFTLPCTTTTFDHENGRGAGKRDDRIEIDGKPQNAAVCLWCNSKKGSKREPYKYQVHAGQRVL